MELEKEMTVINVMMDCEDVHADSKAIPRQDIR